jgi:hypothetical protein
LCNSWLVQWQSADGVSRSTLEGFVSIVFAGGIPIEDCLEGLLHSLGSCPGKSYTLDVVDSGKYPGVTINKDLTWTKHINQTIGKAFKTLMASSGEIWEDALPKPKQQPMHFFRMETHLPFSLPYF